MSKCDETVRLMINRENEVINHRVTWLTATQALLFASVSLIWDKADNCRFSNYPSLISLINSERIITL
jgi:hypothetical protein